MRVAIYNRVSSKKQEDGVSLTDQEYLCRKYAEQQGWTVVHVYTEAGRSAFTEKLDKRIAFSEMLQDASQRKFDVVLIYKINRFARKVLVQYQAAAELERYRIRIVSATEPIERTTASGRATFGVLAVLAELQSDQLSEKMRDTRLAEAREGRHVGPVPVGFVRREGGLVPDERLPAVTRAFELYASRQHSFESVSEVLNAEGWCLPSGRHFTKFQVAEMLRNPVYIGRVRCGQQEFTGKHAAVIDQATWDAVQDEIRDRGATPDRKHRIAAQPALLSGLAFCSNCGAPMWRGGNRGNYYHCSRRLTREPLDSSRQLYCNMRGVQVAAAEAHVLLSLVSLTADVELLNMATNTLTQQATGGMREKSKRNSHSVEEQIRRLGRLYERGLKTDEEFELELQALRKQQAGREQPSTTESNSKLQKAIALLSDLPALLAKATPEEQRALLSEIFDKIYLTPHQAMAVRPAAAYSGTLKALDSSSAFNERFVQWAGWAYSHRTRTRIVS